MIQITPVRGGAAGDGAAPSFDHAVQAALRANTPRHVDVVGNRPLPVGATDAWLRHQMAMQRSQVDLDRVASAPERAVLVEVTTGLREAGLLDAAPVADEPSAEDRKLLASGIAANLGVGFGRSPQAIACRMRAGGLDFWTPTLNIAPPHARRGMTLAELNQVFDSPSCSWYDRDRLYRVIVESTRSALRWTLPLADALDQCMRQLLRAATRQARREFVRTGDPESVSDLAFDWLGLRSGEGQFREITLQAVAEVVISERWADWDTLVLPGLSTHNGRLRFLTRQVKHARSHWKSVWEHTVHGQLVGELNTPVTLPDGETVELVSLLPGDADVERAAEAALLDSVNALPDRLRRVVAELTDEEQRLVIEFSKRGLGRRRPRLGPVGRSSRQSSAQDSAHRPQAPRPAGRAGQHNQ